MEVLGRIYILANPGAWPIIFFYLFGFFVSSFCSVMVFIALARLDKGEKAGLNNFWELFDLSTEKYLRFITTTIAYGLMVLVGTILLIIPGIIFSYKYRLALPMSVLDSKEGEDYLKKSGQMTEGFKFDIFVCLFLAGMALIPLYLAVLIIVCVVCLIFGIAIDKETFNTAVIFCYPLTKPYSIMILYYIYSKFLFRE